MGHAFERGLALPPTMTVKLIRFAGGCYHVSRRPTTVLFRQGTPRKNVDSLSPSRHAKLRRSALGSKRVRSPTVREGQPALAYARASDTSSSCREQIPVRKPSLKRSRESTSSRNCWTKKTR